MPNLDLVYMGWHLDTIWTWLWGTLEIEVGEGFKELWEEEEEQVEPKEQCGIREELCTKIGDLILKGMTSLNIGNIHHYIQVISNFRNKGFYTKEG